MSNEKLARQWAERKKALAKRHMEDAGYFPREDTLAAIEHVLATTTPMTMADVVWDWEKHYLAGATTHDGEEVAMIWPQTAVYLATTKGTRRRDQLTPNGKKYELREVGAPEQPAHPATLVTVGDYENAPEGTIVAESGRYGPTFGKHGDDWLTLTSPVAQDEYEMAGVKRDVLRWGWRE